MTSYVSFCFSAARDGTLVRQLFIAEPGAAEKQKGKGWVGVAGYKQLTPLGFPGRTKSDG
jgi:hypothetical protein